MSLITGVGDEVLEVVVCLVAAAVAALAWWSTAARPDRFRTVILMERRGAQRSAPVRHISATEIRRHLLHGSVVTTSGSPLPPVEATTPVEWREDADGSASESEASTGDNSASERPAAGGEETSPAAGAEQMREMDRIVDAMDADVDALRGGEVQFIARHNGETQTSAQTVDKESATNADVSEIQNTASEQRTSIEPAGKEDSPLGEGEKINIKLKYLNDTFREVDGAVDELLKDFKWRHFPTELSGGSRVLLIFNGRVLAEESNTIRACGLYHNCVVHCLVQKPRQSRTSPAATEAVLPPQSERSARRVAPAPGATDTRQAPAAGEPRAWDLENVLMTLVSVILTVIWFFRCEYSNIFTASASGALFALTLFYSVAIFGLYFSDTFHLTARREERQPAAAAAQTN